ncbi:MAG: hypothetical protein JOZ89_02445 [Gammaproteobacteria bacterium]|nr:hypothetical protein [Gammaproteobacteria bacterium]
MTKRQVLLQLRDGTENELRDLTTSEYESFDQAANDWSEPDALLLAHRRMNPSAVVTPLDLALVKRALNRLCH